MESESDFTPAERESIAKHKEYEKVLEECKSIVSRIPLSTCRLYEFQNLEGMPYDIVQLRPNRYQEDEYFHNPRLYIPMATPKESKYVLSDGRIVQDRIIILANNGLSLKDQRVDALIDFQYDEITDRRTHISFLPVRKSTNLLRKLAFKLFK